LTGATPTVNQIGTVSSYTATGFTLNDGAALLVSGAVKGGGSATITDSAALAIGGAGQVSATAVSLTGSGITIGGTVTDGGAGTTSLIATGGTISEAG